MKSPWGKVDNETRFNNGIIIVDTASHGGAYVPNILLDRIPEKEQEFAKQWSGSVNWYEEDLSVASVTYAFPELFPEFPADKNENFHNALVRGME